MSDLVLFHYPMSPFSEKIRALLGYAGLSWQSVRVEEMPPRPVLDTLAGGYRKIPVAQSGADIFCDTRTIAREIATRANKPELILSEQPEDVQAFVEKVELEIFLACVIAASDARLLTKLFRETSLLHTFRFLKDRITMGRKARVRAMGARESRKVVMAFIADLNERLTQDFLFGAQPCIADFSAYHGLWFACDLAGKPWLRDYPTVAAWMDRIRAFGHGTPTEISPEHAIEQARQSQPRALPAAVDTQHAGQTVSIAPTDYGRDPVTGTLVHSGATETILARETPAVGLVHVHFPKQGFRLKPV
ncbi:glutathione S-transferase family protein [Marinobacter salinisoli]|uniref:Glutathione S-transferase family protein n=1 Tax=Marinobacter salinisoli TaxID=2769486 RepID=A0ABX7MQZ0_9GAMM|nr:glutathione S-transferase family protein [Marinobacter salinisoli]QSP94711.1 glutathione S-transferase family protein [Marinobacter salinisoli]